MESTAINTVYVVMTLNIKTDACYILKVFAREDDALKYKKECYENEEISEGYHIYYIMEEIIY